MNKYKVDEELGTLIRSSILFAGPLLARFGRAEIPLPGGCVLGKRSISAHVDAFEKAGISLKFENGYVKLKAPKKLGKSYDIWLMEASVTATENLLLYSAGVNADFKITEAACEPHVGQLLDLFVQMGVKVQGKGSNNVTINGSNALRTFEFTPDPDFIDIAGLIVATAVTRGKITILNSNIPEIVGGMLQCFEKFNIGVKRQGKNLLIDGSRDLEIDLVNSGFPLAGDNLPKLVPRPWPGFPVDAVPVMVTLGCKTKGQLLVQNWMYETGLDFVNELNALGGRIFVADPQRIIVNGPVKFKGGRISSPSVIQACKALFLAALADPVETVLENTHILKRRYPEIDKIYSGLGATIELIK